MLYNIVGIKLFSDQNGIEFLEKILSLRAKTVKSSGRYRSSNSKWCSFANICVTIYSLALSWIKALGLLISLAWFLLQISTSFGPVGADLRATFNGIIMDHTCATQPNTYNQFLLMDFVLEFVIISVMRYICVNLMCWKFQIDVSDEFFITCCRSSVKWFILEMWNYCNSDFSNFLNLIFIEYMGNLPFQNFNFTDLNEESQYFLHNKDKQGSCFTACWDGSERTVAFLLQSFTIITLQIWKINFTQINAAN